MEDKELLNLLERQVKTLNYYKGYLQIIPGVQEPDCSHLFQAEIDLMYEISKLKNKPEIEKEGQCFN